MEDNSENKENIENKENKENKENSEEDNFKVRKLEGSQISESDDYITFKIIIVGNSGVGKSCLLKRAAQKKYTENYQATIGFEFLLMYYDVDGTKMKLQIWDTCGQEMYRSLIQGFYRNTALTVLIYAVNDQKSFDDLDAWIKDIRSSTEHGQPIFLVGNKCDLDKETKQIKENTGKEFANLQTLEYFSEASAKTGFMVDEIFCKVAKYLYKESYLKGKAKLKKMKLGIDKGELYLNSNQKKKKCC